MKRIIEIEVTPRAEDGHYHAHIDGVTSIWSDGDSIEDAVVSLLQDHRNILELPDSVVACISHSASLVLMTIANILKNNDIELEIKFNPMKIL
jgi:predicted RNase H-like HicB family nuclease